MRRPLSVLVLATLATLAAAATGCDSAADPTGAPSAEDAPARYAQSFRAFADGGVPPRFDDQVDVSLHDRVVLTLTRDRARDRAEWTTPDGPLLGRASAASLRFPCEGPVPSPTGPAVRHDVDAAAVSVLWQPHGCAFAVRLLIDRRDEIAAVAFDNP